jgi:hypothetical protein
VSCLASTQTLFHFLLSLRIKLRSFGVRPAYIPQRSSRSSHCSANSRHSVCTGHWLHITRARVHTFSLCAYSGKKIRESAPTQIASLRHSSIKLFTFNDVLFTKCCDLTHLLLLTERTCACFSRWHYQFQFPKFATPFPIAHTMFKHC